MEGTQEVNNTEGAIPEGATPVDTHDLSDDEIATLLSQGDPEEAEAGGEAIEPATEEPSEKKEPVSDEVDNDKFVSREEYEKLLSQVSKQNKQIEQQEYFIQRRNTELGNLRAQLESRNKELGDLLSKDVLDPQEEIDARLEIKSNKDKLGEVDAHQQVLEMVHTNAKALHHFMQGQEPPMGEMVELLKEDGVDPQYIQHFSTNPLAIMPTGQLVNLAKRAQDRINVRKVAVYAQKLEKEVEGLRAQLKKTPQDVLSKIDRAAKGTQTITASTGGGTSIDRVSSKRTEDLSDEELSVLLQNTK